LKGATKSLSRIKKLVQAYAIAQPSKRFSLKVLKAKIENNNWTYAPNAEASLSDAAFKVAGTEVSSCCVEKRISGGEHQISRSMKPLPFFQRHNLVS
jgi:DNA mismatch repair ATPase MutL